MSNATTISGTTAASTRRAASEPSAPAADAAGCTADVATQLMKGEFHAGVMELVRRYVSTLFDEVNVTPVRDDEGPPLDPSPQEFAETVRVSGDALLAIINDILDLSKVEAGVVELESVDFEPSSVIRSVTELLAGSAAAKGLALVVHVADDMPALRGDPLRIRQVLNNLIGNAVKFTPAGRVAVSACMDATDGTRTTVRLQVDDTGIGMAPHETARIVEPFAQAESSTHGRFGGTGLGLTITRQLVDLMGGRCGVDSTLGTGSSFWCTLPLPIAGTDTQPGPADAPGPARQRCLRLPPTLQVGARSYCTRTTSSTARGSE